MCIPARMQAETESLRQQMQEDWEAAEAERQELLRKMRAEAAAAAEQQERAVLQVWTRPIPGSMVQCYPAQTYWQDVPTDLDRQFGLFLRLT